MLLRKCFAQSGLFLALTITFAGCSKVHSGADTRTSPNHTTNGSAEARITASPDRIAIKSGLGKTTIAWNTGDSATAQIYVSRDGGMEQLVTQGAEGSFEVNWVEPGAVYEFRVYAGLAHTQLLASTTVRGVKAK